MRTPHGFAGPLGIPTILKALIKAVVPHSPAHQAKVTPGDWVIAVNGQDQLEDLFDFQQLIALLDEDTDLVLDILRQEHAMQVVISGEAIQDAGGQASDVGMEFESPIFTAIKTCNNACPFCFIDQQPEGLRPSLYVKDDDYRLSYFCNTYITLTNLTRHDRERMARLRPGPLYVSVHSTVPEVRAELLKNPKAGEIMTELRWLASLDIPFHAQIVVCPTMNDTDSLTQTLTDLVGLAPHCLSVAVVPVGLTQHRSNLPGLIPMTPPTAAQVIDRVTAFLDQTPKARQTVFLSDEFYVMANRPFPDYEAYGDFPQLDDGVGSGRHLVKAFFDLEPRLPSMVSPARNHLIVTGKLAAMMLQPVINRLNQIEGLYIDVMAVENRFWGQAITVAGLITGQDIIYTLKSVDITGYTSVLIPDTMLKSGELLFLDNLTVDQVAEQVGCTLVVVHQPTQAESLLNVLF